MLKRGARDHTKLYGRPIEVMETDNGARLEIDDFGRQVDVDYRYLAWNDIATKRIKQPLWQIYWHMIARILLYHLNGRYFRLMGAYWGFTNGVYYMLLTLLLGSAVTGIVSYWALSSSLGGVGLWAFILVLSYFVPALFFDRFESRFRIKLMWLIFRMSSDHAKGKAPDLEARIDDFAKTVGSTFKDKTIDEVVIVGHSYGSIIATDLAAKLLQNGPDDGPDLAVLTVGDINALHAIAHDNTQFKESITRCSTATDLFSWLCIFSPQDGLNFPKFNTAKEIFGVTDPSWPLFKSMLLRRLVTPARYKALKKSFWDMHFQYFKEGDVQGQYSYFRLIGSARPLIENYGLRPEEEAYAAQHLKAE